MVNYQNGKIYAIRCLTTNARYVGCTTKRLLCQRLAEHVAAYKHFTRGEGPFHASFQVLQRGNYIIELIEVFPCTSRNELVHRETFHNRDVPKVTAPEKPQQEYYKAAAELRNIQN